MCRLLHGVTRLQEQWRRDGTDPQQPRDLRQRAITHVEETERTAADKVGIGRSRAVVSETVGQPPPFGLSATAHAHPTHADAGAQQ